MIQTFCAFIYGHTVDDTNSSFDFKEGAGSELNATLTVGEYSLTDFVTELARAINFVGALDYIVSVNRDTRIITISATGAFTILGATGTNNATSVLSLAGFAAADTSSAVSHAGALSSGYVWQPQFKPQDYVAFNDQQSAIDGTVKQSSSGEVEVARFGTKKIMDANFTFITDIPYNDQNTLKTDLSGVSNARSFMEYATTKADLEFIPDVSDMDTFNKVLLESTPESSDGLAFKLKELYGRGLPGYYETGTLKFRLIE